MKRTIDIMTTARAKGVELPEGWWLTSQYVERCSTCHSDKGVETIDLGYGDKRRICEACGVDIYCDEDTYYTDEAVSPPRYIGPDLERAENIHHAFTVADALAKPGCRTEVWWVEERKLFSVTLDDGFNEIFAPERHLALVAACEAALGIQHEKENT